MTEAFARFDAFPHARIDDWSPAFPAGRLDRIYLHWSAGDYVSVFPAYHYCIAWHDEDAIVAQTNDLRANMRDVYASQEPYAAHTFRRNSYAAGLSVMAMRDARPDNFGAFPLIDVAVEALCTVAARIAAHYAIPIDADHILTHAEAAIIDGYYGAANDDERWDIARLTASDTPLTEQEAHATGSHLRNRIAAAH